MLSAARALLTQRHMGHALRLQCVEIPRKKPPSRHIHIYIFSKDMLGGWQIGLLLEIHIGVCLMVSITQFKYTMVGRFEHTMLIQQQRPLLSCLLKANCTCYALARGTQLLLTALPN